jgi:hypothetical protein
MQSAGSRSVKFALLGAVVCALCASASCSQDGVTTNCPARPLYQTFPLGDASPVDAMSGDSAAAREALIASIDAGCATGPNGLGGPAGGGSGKGGSSGTAGAAGELGGVGGETSSGGDSPAWARLAKPSIFAA